MSSKSPSLKHNYLMNLAYQILSIVVPIITTPYVSRVLTPDGIGAYSYSLSIVTYFSMFATLGMATYGQLQIAQFRDNKEIRSKIFVEIVIARLSLSLVVVAAYFLCKPILGMYGVLYNVLVINIVSCALDVSWFFQGLEEFRITVTRNFIIRIISTVLIFACIRTKNDLVLYAIIIQGSTLLGNISLMPYIRKYVILTEVGWRKIPYHLKESIVYFIPTIATSVYTILDKSMLGWIFKSAAENGYYEQAHKIEQMLVVIVTSLGVVTLPRMVYLHKNSENDEINRIMEKTLAFVLMISVPMCFGLIGISKTLIPIFLGAGYEPCIPLLRIFSLLLVLIGLDNTIGRQCLVAFGRQKEYNRGVICGAITNLSVNIILIPRLGAVGAAIATVSAEFVILSIFLFLSRGQLSIIKFLLSLFKYLLSGITMLVAVLYTASHVDSGVLGLIFQITVGILVYLICLLIAKDKYIISIIRMVVNKITRK